MLVVRSVAGLWKGKQLNSRQLLGFVTRLTQDRRDSS